MTQRSYASQLTARETPGNGATAREPRFATFRSPGPLPPEQRRPLERSFRDDFSDVRIVPRSPEASAMGALAVARGDEIHLSHQAPGPATLPGRALIAHELAHVTQQRQGRVEGDGEIAGRTANREGGLEREAATAARRAALGLPVSAGTFGVGGIGSAAAGPPQPGSPGPLAQAPAQRLVGFELEMSVPVTPAAGGNAAQEYLFGGIQEGTRLVPAWVNLPDQSFYLETDHDELGSATLDLGKDLAVDNVINNAPPSSPKVANMEYVMKPLDELEPGSDDKFADAFDDVRDHMNGIWGQNPVNTRTAFADNNNYAVGVPSTAQWQNSPWDTNDSPGGDLTVNYANQIRDIRRAVTDRLYLQATAGIVPAQLGTLLGGFGQDRRFSGGAEEELNGRAVYDARETVNWLRRQSRTVDRFTGFELKSLDGWLALIYQYLYGNELWITTANAGGVAKNMVTFLSKIDLGKSRRALPRAVRDFLDEISSNLSKRLRNVILNDVDRAKKRIRKDHTVDTSIKRPIRRPAIFLLKVLQGKKEAFTGSQLSGRTLGFDTLPRRAQTANTGRTIPLEFRSINARPQPGGIANALSPIIDEVRDLNTKHLGDQLRNQIIDEAKNGAQLSDVEDEFE